MKKEQLIDYKSSILAVANTIANFRLSEYLKDTDSPTDITKILDRCIDDIAEKDTGFVKGSRFYNLVRSYILNLIYIDTKFDMDGITYCISAPIVYDTNNPNKKILYSCYITRRIDKRTNTVDSVIIAHIMGFKNADAGIGKVLTTEKMYLYNISKYNLDTLYIAIKDTIKATIVNKMSLILDNSFDISNIDKALSDMTMLTTLAYMKVVIPSENYAEFIQLEEEDSKVYDITDINNIIFNINAILYSIGTKDKAKLSKILGKISDILKEESKNN